MAEKKNPREFVRVSDKRTGHEYTTTRAVAEGDKNLNILPNKEAAFDGRPRDAKFKTDLAGEPAASSTGGEDKPAADNTRGGSK